MGTIVVSIVCVWIISIMLWLCMAVPLLVIHFYIRDISKFVSVYMSIIDILTFKKKDENRQIRKGKCVGGSK